MKKVIVAVAIVVCLLAAGLLVFVGNIDTLVTKVIEDAGSAATGTAVTVDHVAVSLSEGTAVVRGLHVVNPPGFSSQSAMSFGELSVEIDIKTRGIRRIRAVKPVFSFEERNGQTNFSVLESAISGDSKQTASASAPRTEPGPMPERKTADGGRKIRIDRLEIENALITVTSDRREKKETVTLKRLVIENLYGTGEQIARQIVARITETVISVNARKLIEKEVKRAIEKHGGKKIQSFLKGILGSGKEP